MEEMIGQHNEVEKMANQYFAIEEKILKELEKLPNNEKECDCDESNRFCIVDDDEIVCKCLRCGGDIYW